MKIPDEMEKRLLNWGRWARQGHSIGNSPIQALSRERALENGVAEDKQPLNVLDAEYINNLWRRMPCGRYEDRKIKAVLAMMYCSSAPIRDSLRIIRRQQQLRIRESEVDRLYELGVKRFAMYLGYTVESC